MRLEMGALAPPLAQQLSDQGIVFDDTLCAKWQRWGDDLLTLRTRGGVVEERDWTEAVTD